MPHRRSPTPRHSSTSRHILFTQSLLTTALPLTSRRLGTTQTQRHLTSRPIGAIVLYLWFLCMYYFCYLEDCGRVWRKFQWPVFTKELIVDLANALLCQMSAMCEVCGSYKTSKISSTISEHFFARMRRTMGPDQSADNFTRILIRNVICDLNDSQMAEDMKMSKRLFDSALCESGAVSPDPTIATQVRDFVCELFAQCSVSLSPQAPHQEVFERAPFYDLENSCVIAWFRQLNPTSKKAKFIVHAGQTRARRIYGRAILSRYTTAAKREEGSQETVAEKRWRELEDSLAETQ